MNHLPDPIALPHGYIQRPWQTEDLDSVTALDALIFGPDAWSHALFADEYAASEGSVPDRFYQVITHHDEAIIGFAGLLYGPPFADVTTIGIHPDHTGNKLGAALLVWLIRTAHKLGAEDLLLEVRADNTVAQRLYADNGFTHIHTRRRYYPGGVDAWVMRKRLRHPGPSTAVALSNKE